MSENSKIEWTDHTFNPWIGCAKVSPGCDNCYAAVSTPARVKGIKWGVGEARLRTADSTWKQPKTWNARHDAFFAEHGRRQRVFCASLADVFDNEVDNNLRNELLGLIYDTPNLDWLLLTKRIGNVPRLMEECTDPAKQWELPPNVWLGATIVNQSEADRDIPKLLATPAAVRFLSMEPLLGPVELDHEWLLGERFEHSDDCRDDLCALNGDAHSCLGQIAGQPRVDWIIVGGESGPGARPMHPDWARSLRDQCADAGVPFLFKQWGEWHTDAWLMSTGAPVFRQFDTFQQWVNKASTWVHGGICLDVDGRELRNGGDFMRARDEGKFPVTIMHKVGKKAAGRLLDGVTHDEFPLPGRHDDKDPA